MMSATEVLRWLNTLPNNSDVAIDEGGICLVEIDWEGNQTEAYLEIGGTPDDETTLEEDTDAFHEAMIAKHGR
jgi:hypothetical protein